MTIGLALCGLAVSLGYGVTPRPIEPVESATLDQLTRRIDVMDARLQSIEQNVRWLWLIAGGGSVAGGGLSGWLSTRRRSQRTSGGFANEH